MAIVWRDQMSLGNTLLDNDHKYLIYLINSFERSIHVFNNSSNLLVALKLLNDYASLHFQREEQLQERLGFPGLDHHRRCHIKMKDELKTSMDDLLSGESMGRKGMDQPQFIEFLRHWMLEHIIKEDLLLKPYLKSE